ncbi:MAG: hypothetical protein AABX98_04445, partial [Nanoarchaeota archaeon]
MIQWNSGVVREQTPLWSSLICRSMYEFVSEPFSVTFSFTKGRFIENRMCIDQKEVDEFYNLIQKNDKEDSNFLHGILEEYDQQVSKLIENCVKVEKLKKFNLTMSSFKEVIDISMPVFAQTMPTAYVLDQYMEKKVRDLLEKEFKEKGEEYFHKIAIPSKKNISTIEIEEVLKSALEPEEIKQKSEYLAKKYGWLNMRHFKGTAFTQKEYERRVLGIKEPKKALREYKEKEKQRRKDADEVMKLMKEKERRSIENLQKLVYMRTAKKDALTYYGYCLLPIREVLNKKLGVEDAYYLTYWEILEALQKKTKMDNKIMKRRDGYNYLFENGKMRILDKDDKSMEEKEESLSVKELKGMCASKGKVRGEVVVIRKREEIAKMKYGKIIVTTMTTPDFGIA